eukprot:6974215-Alexandrium_andersonii.AAC.1
MAHSSRRRSHTRTRRARSRTRDRRSPDASEDRRRKPRNRVRRTPTPDSDSFGQNLEYCAARLISARKVLKAAKGRFKSALKGKAGDAPNPKSRKCRSSRSCRRSRRPTITPEHSPIRTRGRCDDDDDDDVLDGHPDAASSGD